MSLEYPIMKDVLHKLANAYGDILVNNLTLDGNTLPVYNGMAPTTETGSYVLVGADMTAVQTANKCTYMWEAIILIDCVVKNGNFGFEDSDNVRSQVGELVNTALNPDLSPDFQIITTDANTFRLQGLNPTEPIFRSLVRYTHKIVQS